MQKRLERVTRIPSLPTVVSTIELLYRAIQRWATS
uniref:Uncharacterized protein n=1 Tax=Anguilla anguilla TaxID=7936 RepID=A0A0E9S4N5_ANGAN